jgi:hypothetical protein
LLGEEGAQAGRIACEMQAGGAEQADELVRRVGRLLRLALSPGGRRTSLGQRWRRSQGEQRQKQYRTFG